MKNSEMKAVVCTWYGSANHLEVQTLPRPVPGDNDVLVQVSASTVTAADSMMRRANPFISRFFLGLFRPKHAVMGTGFAGTVVETGSAVTRFSPGDAVFGESGLKFGANAEFVCLTEDGVILPKPDTISFKEAATLCDGPMTSFNFLKNLGKIEKGQQVLINGASGSLGSAAVQIASHYGAEVTGICSAKNINLVQQLGASKVVDYTKTDPRQIEGSFDLIYDTVGKLRFSECKRLLKPRGTFLSPVLNFGLLWQMLLSPVKGQKKAVFSATGLLPSATLRLFLHEILPLVTQKHLKIVIDKEYSLQETATAHRYVDTGRKKGNVLILPG